MWKDFLYFTKTERQGVIVLVVLISAVFALPELLSVFNRPEEPDVAGQERFRKEYDDFVSSLKELPKASSGASGNTFLPLPSSARTVRLTAFDPNTADSMTFLSLGLSPRTIRNILRYRSKQGRFRRPEDFGKIYNLTKEEYQTLLPYIRIAASVEPKDTSRVPAVPTWRPDSLAAKYPPGTVVSLNSADTSELKRIPGIGSVTARRIVAYRQQLGAFCRIEQLQEIQLDVEAFRPWFAVDSGQISRINLNKASLTRMMHHPYINFYQAKVIVEHRRRKGDIRSLRQLSLYAEFTPADIERLEPYVCCDE